MQGTLITIKAGTETVKAADMAVNCQDAVNGRAILASLLRHLDEMRQSKECHGGDMSNQHPVVIAVMDKLASLARTQDLGNDRIIKAHDACEKLAAGEDVEWEIFPL